MTADEAKSLDTADEVVRRELNARGDFVWKAGAPAFVVLGPRRPIVKGPLPPGHVGLAAAVAAVDAEEADDPPIERPPWARWWP